MLEIIPYFASKFTPDHFKRIQIKVSFSSKHCIFNLENINKDE
jgi:hypothetical protein